MHSQPVKLCQICHSESLKHILSLGYVTPVNTMQKIEYDLIEQPSFPLELKWCDQCALAQIGLAVDGAVLFPKDYPYLSGSTRILRENFEKLCQQATEICSLKSGDFIIDIGSNDGTLLSSFKKIGYRVLGVEPTDAAKIAIKNGIETIQAFFNKKTAAEVKSKYGLASLITAANVFAHIDDVHSIVDGIMDLLAPKGVFISENHYLISLVERVQYDTIYHEHLRYYSLMSLQNLFAMHDMEIFHAEPILTHGGSVRVYSARKGERKPTARLLEMLQYERDNGFADGSVFDEFKKKVLFSKTDLVSLLGRLRRDGSRVFGIGAPSRASTLINYTGINSELVDCVAEISSSHKLNKYMPGTRIPVLDESLLYQEQPEYALLLSWHIADELIENLRKKGYKGKFIVPLPEVAVVD